VPETPGKNAYPFAPSRDPERWSFRFAPCKMSIPRTQQRTDFRRKQELFPILGSRFGYGRFCLKLERREKKCQHRATQRNRQLCFTNAPVSSCRACQQIAALPAYCWITWKADDLGQDAGADVPPSVRLSRGAPAFTYVSQRVRQTAFRSAHPLATAAQPPPRRPHPH
jgi:hypothetical protein